MLWRKFTFFIVLMFVALVMGADNAPKYPTYRIVFTQEPIEVQKTREASGRVFRKARSEGSRIVALQPDGTISVLTPEFASACDPSVSFDGKRILFAGKRTSEEQWNIYEMNADGSEKSQITSNLSDCMEPLYLAMASVTPPNFDDRVRWITFTSTVKNALDDQGKELAPSLYVMSLLPVKGRGTVLWRTTYNLGGDISPTVMQDGRVLFSSRQRGNFALMTITWAGDNINPFYGTHEGPAIKTMACEMPDRTVVFIESDRETPDCGGQLARVSLRRPLHSHEVLSKGEGRYRIPHPFPEEKLVVSYASGEESYRIYFFDFETGRPGRKIYDDPAWNDVDAMPILPHPEPMARIPMLEFASVLDIGGFKEAGQLHCMNIYDSDQPEVSQLKPGQVKWARFVEGVPTGIRNLEFGSAERNSAKRKIHDSDWPPPSVKTRILGEAPVEPDGSFFVNIVGNIPFFIQILDEHKMALYTMRAWGWVRSGSQRGCIGCHEDKELAPENRATQALLKMQPAFLIDPPENRRTVDFRHNVMPIVNQRCASCHSGVNPRGGFNLSSEPTEMFNRAYANLLKPEEKKKYVVTGSARQSPLIWQIFGRQIKTSEAETLTAVSISQMPPDKPLSDVEQGTFVEWIDLGAKWDNLSETGE